jgi:DNA polymerase-3 subunit beta
MVNWFRVLVTSITGGITYQARDRRRRTLAAVLAVRDRAAAGLLGIPVDRLSALRALAVNPPAGAGSSARRGAAKSEAAAVGQVLPIAFAQGCGTVEAKVFMDAVTRVNKAVTTKSSLPILSHILIAPDLNPGREYREVILRATDMEVGIETRVSIETVGAGFQAFTVDAKTLRNTLKGTKSRVSFRTETGKTHFLMDDREVTLDGFPADEFPQFPEVTGERRAVPGFLEATNAVIPAMSRDFSRTTLMGILVEEFRVVATDTHRLHIAPLDAPANTAWKPVIVPGAVCGKLAPMFGLSAKEKGAEIRMAHDDEPRIAFEHGNTRITARIIEGRFPNYQTVIPEDCDAANPFGQWVVDPAALAEAVRGLAPIAADDSNRITMTAKGKTLELHASAPDNGGEATATIKLLDTAGTWQGKEAAFSAAYLLDIAHTFADAAAICINGGPDSLAPILVTAMNEGPLGHKAVLMPMELR